MYPVIHVTLVVLLCTTGCRGDRGRHEGDKKSDSAAQLKEVAEAKSPVAIQKHGSTEGKIAKSGVSITYHPNAGQARNVRPHSAAMTASGAMIRTKAHPVGRPGDDSSPQALPLIGQPSNGSNMQAVEQLPPIQQLPPVQQLDPMEVEMNDTQLIASTNDTTNVSNKDYLMAMAGGTGATIGGTGILSLDQDLVRRMRVQDKAVMLLLLVMYFVTLGFSASFAYRQAINNSPVTFYADPRFHDMVTEGRNTDVFLQNFSGSPKDVHLQVTGFVPVPSGVLGSVEWQGEYFYDAFSFALDLSPWVVRQGTTDGSEPGPWGDNLRLANGVVADDMENLHQYISDRNDLAILEVQKEVSWPSWEELATNIKTTIRQQGFTGLISVHRTDCDTVSVYKNSTWANFMHSRTTKVLCALSVLGWVIYLPYMWLRCTSTTIRARYTIDISISEYWRLIADKLTADGFVDNPNALPLGARRGSGEFPSITTGQFTAYVTGGRLPDAGDESAAGEADWQSGAASDTNTA